MNLSYITKEKAQSLAIRIPGLLGQIALAPEESSYVLLSEEKMMATFFAVAIVVEGEVFYLSDEKLLPALESFLAEE